MTTQAMRQSHDENAPIRELLLRQHAVLRDRWQTLQRQAGAAEIDTEGIALSGHEEARAAAEEVSRQIVETDLALAKLDRGTYGICDGCGRSIPPRRLEVVPTATRCVACAESSLRTTWSDPHARRGAARPRNARRP